MNTANFPKTVIVVVLVFIISSSAISAQQNKTQVASASNMFSQDIAKQVLKSPSEQSGNIIISPFSIFAALSMVYTGARQSTKTEMDVVLHYSETQLTDGSDLPSIEVAQQYETLLSSLTEAPTSETAKPGYNLTIANSLWLQYDMTINQSFVSIAQEYFRAEVAKIDFKVNFTEATDKINTWVANKTMDQIQDLIPQGALTDKTRGVLANAIYLKAQWAKPFEKALTSMRNFTTFTNDTSGAASSNTVQVDMMLQTESFKVGSLEGFRAIELPYISESKLAMVVLVPEQAEQIAALQDKLTSDRQFLTNVQESLAYKQVNLRFPKFKYEYRLSAKDSLVQLGMPTAFASQANFTGITEDEQLRVGDILHKAFIVVDEDGTEAAAASAAMMTSESISEEEPEDFHVDRAFMYYIYHQEAGAVLFVGQVADPSSAQ